MLRKMLCSLAALTMLGSAGCAVYVPGPAVYARPGVVIAPAPVVVGPVFPFGYYGYYGWHHGYWR
jgi:hypothetical protein